MKKNMYFKMKSNVSVLGETDKQINDNIGVTCLKEL